MSYFVEKDGHYTRPRWGRIAGTALSTVFALSLGTCSVDYVDGKHVGLRTQAGTPTEKLGTGWHFKVPLLQGIEEYPTTRQELEIGDADMRVRFKDGIYDNGSLMVAYKNRRDASFQGLSTMYVDFQGDADKMVKQKIIQSAVAVFKNINSYELDPEVARRLLINDAQARLNAANYDIEIEDLTVKGFAGDAETEKAKREFSRSKMRGQIINQEIANSTDAARLAAKAGETGSAAYRAFSQGGVPNSQITQMYCLESARSLEGDNKAFAIAGCMGGSGGVVVDARTPVAPTIRVQMPKPE